MVQKICNTPCDRCSCKGERISINMKYLGELYELRCERKKTGTIFQCYIRANGEGCNIHHKQILWMDRNIDKVKEKLGLTF